LRRHVDPAGNLTRALLLGVALTFAVGCGSTTTPASQAASSATVGSPSGPPVLGIDWGQAASLERPANYEPDPSAPPWKGDHPNLRFTGQAMLTDVTALPGGGHVAVGYVPPDWLPAAWTSPDGTTWSLHDMGASAATFPVALAVGTDGDVVAVGRSGKLPVAWTTRDGVSWQRHEVAVPPGSDVAERMTAVAAGARGFVAGGSVGPELLDRHARFWTSADGADWQAVPDDASAFASAEVRAITAFGEGFAAVGVVGSAQKPTGAVAWTSSDGTAWTRVDEPSFAGGTAVAIAAAPFGGLVAVGADLDRREALVWTSPDGRHWTRAPTEPSRVYPGRFVWMTDVAPIGDVVIAIGDYQALQRGTAMAWVSRDGIHWDRANSAPVQEQGEFYAIAPGGPGAIVVGSFGAPDSYVPRVWISPAR
jgi:hypothetical protein